MKNETGDIASFFDSCALRGDMADFQPDEEERVRELLELWQIGPGKRVLEVGCGAGRLTERLARRVGERGEVLAVDLSPEMIRKAEARGIEGPVEFVCGDVCKIPRSDAWFDCIVCFCVLPHLRPLRPALSEMAWVARPGAGLWICHLMCSAEIHAFHRHVGTVVADHYLPDEKTLREELDLAGFDVVRFVDDTERGYRLEAVRRELENR